MNTFDYIPLVSLPLIYFAVAFIKPGLKLPFNPCAICAAVFITWVIMLSLWFLGFEVGTESIAILMGMSIAGLMYKMEILYKDKKIRNFWLVRLALIVGGFYTVTAMFRENWNVLAFTAILTFFAILIPTIFFQKLTHEDVVKESHGTEKSLLQKLEDCC